MFDKTAKRAELLQRGYVILEGLVTPGLLDDLRHAYRVDVLTNVPKDQFGSSGGLISLDLRDPLTVRLVAWPPTIAALHDLGLPEPKIHSGYVSTKPPGATGLVWHSDVFYPYTGPEPPEVFVLYYLEDTHPGNGCLRVVPGSHLRPDTLEAALHTEGVADSGYQPGEVDVPIRAGDVFVGDRRLLHATHPNNSGWRTGITVAYADFDALPGDVQKLIAGNKCFEVLSDSAEIPIDLRPLLPPLPR